MRTGTVLAKASKLDPVFQSWSVRETDGEIEYFHKQNNDWYTLPSNLVAHIVWD